MIENKNAIGSVVATSLLLIVVVIGVIAFQTWFQTFSSSTFSNVELNSQNSNNLEIEAIIGNNLYLKNSEINLTINRIEIDGINCNISGNYSNRIIILNISNCLDNLSTNIPEIVVFTNDKIIVKKEYLENINILNLYEGESFSCLTNGTNGFANGDGSSISPYQICNCFQLQNLSNDLLASYEIISNIDCSITNNWNWNGSRYEGFDPIGYPSFFEGSLDGNNFTISNLYFNRHENLTALIGYLKTGSILKNFNLIDVNLTGDQQVGSVVGQIYGGTLDKIYVSGSVKGNYYVGGVIGFVNDQTTSISNILSNVSVNGGQYAGGFYGGAAGFDIILKNSLALGNVIGSPVGGFAAIDTNSATAVQYYSYNFWDKNTTNQLNSYHEYVNQIEGKTTNELKTISTFSAWDSNIWNITNGNYPKLIFK